ncbi:MAG: hypothetical protein JKY53_13550 [Flavobacteriales bacterium]|nr:hypothetical protein [Flavobacteriales bacterium]
MNKVLTLLFIILSFHFAIGQTEDYKVYLLEQSLPSDYSGILKDLNLDTKYELSGFMNPFYLVGDFNGDQIEDIAITIKEIDSGKLGFIIIDSKLKEYNIIGAGQSIGNGGDDFSWLDIWKIYDKDIIEPGVGESETIILKNKAIYVIKAESASAVIYWTGKEYKWVSTR